MLISKSVAIGLALVAVAIAAPIDAQDNWDALERQDLRLLDISERLMSANAPLCRNIMPATGLVLHSRDQYGDEGAGDRFANGRIAVASVSPGGPAELAGLRRNDGIVAINSLPTEQLPQPESGYLRETAFFMMASQPAGEPLKLRVRRDGELLDLTIRAPAACHSLVEIVTGDAPRALSDGRVIQIRHDFAASLSDDQLAVALAHELAHAALEHRRRKVDEGIDNGTFAGVGANQRANRQAEIEADRLSVHILANAQYDPALAADFWRSEASSEVGGGILPSAIYPTREARARGIEREIANYLPQGRGPSWPGHLLALRDRPFGGD